MRSKRAKHTISISRRSIDKLMTDETTIFLGAVAVVAIGCVLFLRALT